MKNMPKQPKYSSKFQEKWLKEYTCITRSKKGIHYAFCTVCACDFGVEYGGKNDVTQHQKTAKHKEALSAVSSTRRISEMFPTGTSMVSKVTNAEGLFTSFLVQHNMPFRVADHFTKLVPMMFPDSKIAEGFSCSRTKTSAMVREVYGPHYDATLVDMLKTTKFSLMVDETTDRNTDKQLVILARLFIDGDICTKFVDMPVCNLSTADDIFTAIDKSFRNRGIPWANVFAFNSDNCSVMKGQRNGLISKLRKVSPNIIDVGCVCHLANLAVGTTLKKVPVNVDELLCDIFSHFSISSKRIEELKEFQSFVGVQEDKLLKHCPTRWLSVRRCLARLLEQYEALKSYFISHPDAEKQRSKVARLNEVLSDQLTLPWLNFVMTALEPYHTFNQKFQSEDVLVTDLYNSMLKLIRTVMAFYVPVSTIKAADNISEIEHTDRSLQCHDIEVNCGTTARALITALEDTVPASEIANFFSQVRDALEAGVTKMVKVFPLASKTLQLAPIAVPGNKDQYTLSQVQSLASAFSISDPTVLDKIGQEWLEFQLEDIEVTKSVGEFWCDSKTGAAYPNLANLMRVLLSIPHSNASCERVFSMLKKIATEQRTHLAHDTINALLRLKINSKGCCIDTEFDSNMLKNLKRAATDYNTKHMFGSGASTSATPDPAE